MVNENLPVEHRVQADEQTVRATCTHFGVSQRDQDCALKETRQIGKAVRGRALVAVTLDEFDNGEWALGRDYGNGRFTRGGIATWRGEPLPNPTGRSIRFAY